MREASAGRHIAGRRSRSGPGGPCDGQFPRSPGRIRRYRLYLRSSPTEEQDVLGLSKILETIGAQDEFDVTVCISDRLEDFRKPENILFFSWSNSPDPQYIPLRPVFERLQSNPQRDRLMASLYR